MFMFLNNTTFSLEHLLPVVILLAVASLIPVVLSLLHIKIIPVLVIEILAGLILASIPLTRNLFVQETSFLPLSNGLYIVGMGMLLFLSGLDTDYGILKKTKIAQNEIKMNISFLTTILLLVVILISIGMAFIFWSYLSNKVVGIILLTIIFSSTFASIVVPLVNEECKQTLIGKIINSYATKAELTSIVALSILMIVLGITEEQKPWLLIVVVIILIIVYLFNRYLKLAIFKRITDGIVHFGIRLTIMVLLFLMIICEKAGAEFILGAFLAGMVIKAAHPSEKTIHKLEAIGYGLFIPMFYILVGLKVGLIMPINELFTKDNILLIISLCLVLIIVKIPFMYLCRWFNFSTVLQTTLMVACTLIVSITAEEFGAYTETFSNALIVASCITCIIPPILFDITKHFGYSKTKEGKSQLLLCENSTD